MLGLLSQVDAEWKARVMTLDPYEVLAHWLGTKPYAEVTRGDYEGALAKWIEYMGEDQVWRARPRDAADWAASDSARTTAWRISALDSYYRHAATLDKSLPSPVHPGMRPNVTDLPPGRLRLTPAQVATYLSALDRYTGIQAHRARALGYLVLGMNLRAFQATTLDLDDLTKEQHRTTAAVPLKGGGRSPQTRRVEVPPPVLMAIDDYLPRRVTVPPHSTETTGPLLTSGRGKRLDAYNSPRDILRAVASSHPLLADLTPQITTDGLAASPSPFTAG